MKSPDPAVRQIVDDFMRLRAEIFGSRRGMPVAVLTLETSAAQFVQGGVTPELARQVMADVMRANFAEGDEAPRSLEFCRNQLRSNVRSLRRTQDRGALNAAAAPAGNGHGKARDRQRFNGHGAAPAPDMLDRADRQWLFRLREFHETGHWDTGLWGPPLDDPGCKVPRHLLDRPDFHHAATATAAAAGDRPPPPVPAVAAE